MNIQVGDIYEWGGHGEFKVLDINTNKPNCQILWEWFGSVRLGDAYELVPHSFVDMVDGDYYNIHTGELVTRMIDWASTVEYVNETLNEGSPYVIVNRGTFGIRKNIKKHEII